MISLMDQTTEIVDMGHNIMASFAHVRANTLKLNLLQRVMFRDAAIRAYFGNGCLSCEEALREAAKEVMA